MAGSKDVANVEAVLLKMLRLRPKVHKSAAEQSPEEEELLNQIEGQLATMSKFFLDAYSAELSRSALKEVVKLTGASSDDGRGDFTNIKQASASVVEEKELESDRVCFEQEVEIVTSQSSTKGKRKRRRSKKEEVKSTRMKVPVTKPRL